MVSTFMIWLSRLPWSDRYESSALESQVSIGVDAVGHAHDVVIDVLQVGHILR